MTTLIFDENTRVADLVLAAQAGDHDAFAALVERYERTVYSAALARLRDYTEAQELCQEVFVQAFQKLHQLREPAAFGGWLRSITARMAINRVVRRSPDLPTEPEAMAAVCISRQTPLDDVLDNERRSQVRDGLSRLGDLDRETLEAFYVRGRSLIEMADEFEAPVGTIKRRLHVARKRLAKEVEDLVAV